MTPFEIIIIGIIYLFCIAFYIRMAANIGYSSKFVLILTLIFAPIFTVSVMGIFVAEKILRIL